MSRHNTATFPALGDDVSLVPERYDPVRFNADASGIPLGAIAQVISESVQPSEFQPNSYVILDTTHAFAGFVNMASYSAASASTQSLKKIAKVGDVIVSRLRPYLKQVAYLDRRILGTGTTLILCSTEFFVLRGNSSDDSIAFLVPFLLSAEVQSILAASQEGGHHPRFNVKTLTGLRVPKALFERRQAIDASVRSAVERFRDSEVAIAENITLFDSSRLPRPNSKVSKNIKK